MVTDLVQIRSLADAKREENVRFRRYLKAHHIPDRLFRAVAQEVEKEINCTVCAGCCRHTRVNVSPEDIEELARYLGMDAEQVRRQYTVPDSEPGRRILAQTGDACAFLDGNLCLVYEARPRVCRHFPWVDDDERSLGGRLSSVCDRAWFCPIVYNALESYKRLTGYHDHPDH